MLGVSLYPARTRDLLRPIAKRLGFHSPDERTPLPELRGLLKVLDRIVESPDDPWREEYHYVTRLTLRPVLLDPPPTLERRIETLRNRYARESAETEYERNPVGGSLDEYLEALRVSWAEHRARESLTGRLFKLWFAVENSGSAQATAIVLTVEFPHGFAVSKEIPSGPRMPGWPLRKAPRVDARGHSYLLKVPPPLPLVESRAPTVSVRGNAATFRLHSLRHRHKARTLPPVYVVTPTTPGTYVLRCRGEAIELPEPTSSAIELVVNPVPGGKEAVAWHAAHTSWICPPESYAALLEVERAPRLGDE